MTRAGRQRHDPLYAASCGSTAFQSLVRRDDELRTSDVVESPSRDLAHRKSPHLRSIIRLMFTYKFTVIDVNDGAAGSSG